IKVLSQGNDDIFVEIASKDEGLYSPSYTLSGRTDAQGKAVLNYKLSDGEYVAGIYAQRGSEKVRGNESEFVVEGTIDGEFFVEDLVVKEEYEHERITKSLGEFVAQVVETVEKIQPRFSANAFVEYRRTGDKVYFVEGKVRIPDDKNKVVYLAYQSITTGSVVIADASQGGKFSEMIPKILAKGEHSLMTYAYDPKEDKSTSLFRIVFERM
ncbi:MAG: hypothetical protein PHP74_00545, partial [Candidatus Gracilibacteria bacterium]|nr:hypothetical protein [Candidatus Gracilibacteria bacterium]